MKKTLLACLLLAAASAAFAAEPAEDDFPPPKNPPSEKTKQMIKDELGVCENLTIKYGEMVHKLPDGLQGVVVRADSPRAGCVGQYLSVTSRAGDFYFGIPWFL